MSLSVSYTHLDVYKRQYQYTTFPLGTEDCLTLDVYSSSDAKKRPVLGYLHGSAATGSSLALPGCELVRDAGCVFVALNYRLGLFRCV